MTYDEFRESVKKTLINLPEEEGAAILDFYSEMFQDHLDHGMSAEEAASVLLASIEETVKKEYGSAGQPREDQKKKPFSESNEKYYCTGADISHIEVQDIDHNIIIRQGNTSEIQVIYHDSPAEKNDNHYTFSVQNGTLFISYVNSDKKHWWNNFHRMGWFENCVSDKLQLLLPKNSPSLLSFTVKTCSGDIDAAAKAEDLTLVSMSGDIKIRGEAKKVRASSLSGDVSFEGKADSLDIKSTSGDVSLTGSPSQTFSRCCAGSTSGDVRLYNIQAQELTVSSVSGDVFLSRCDTKSLSLRSVSGDISGTLLTGKSFNARSTSGQIILPAPDAAGGEATVKTVSGSIKIQLA